MRKFFPIFIGSLALLCAPALASARVSFSFEGYTPPGLSAADFGVRILVDSDEPVNAFDLIVSYPVGLAKLTGIDTSRSIADLWQSSLTPPDGNQVPLVGAATKPFIGTHGEFATLIFNGLRVGSSTLHFVQADVYRADGKGTLAEVETQDQSLALYAVQVETTSTESVSEASGVGQVQNGPTPAGAGPTIGDLRIVDNSFAPGEKLLIFTVGETNGVLRRTAVRTRSWLFWSAWQEARNPFPVPSGAWAVDFAAVDSLGNVAERVLYRSDIILEKGGLVLAVIILLLLARYYFVRRRRKRALQSVQ